MTKRFTPHMYPNRQPRDGAYERHGGYGGGSSEYLESRRSQRESSTLSIWPPSPKALARTLLSTERGSSRRRKYKRDHDHSETTPTDSSDSGSERRRRERKERKRARRERERKEEKDRRGRRRRSRGRYDTEEDERSRERNDDRRRSKSESRPQSPSPSPAPSSSRISVGDGEWVEKPVAVTPFVVASQNNGSMPPPVSIPLRSERQADEVDDDDDSDMDFGPQPLMKANASKKVDERAYGGALLRGEGSAMAAFLKDDTDTRIPRRGEIGLTSGEIAQFESVGYVMSGSRHKRMNAVRIRKENQVISAEERRSILMLQKDERERREAILREEFSELVQEKLKGPETKRAVT